MEMDRGRQEGDRYRVADTHAVLYNSRAAADVALAAVAAVVVGYWSHCERLFWPTAN